MKKILVVLLVLAVATGVFAQQGEWSLSGTVDIGAYIDFDPDGPTNGDNEEVLYTGSGWFQPYDYYGPINGKLEIGYQLESTKVEVRIGTYDELFGGGVTHDGENFKFQADADLGAITGLLGGAVGNSGRLWGYYKLLNDLVHLEVAYNSRDAQFWSSDTTGAFADEGGPGSSLSYFHKNISDSSGWDWNSKWSFHGWETWVFGGGSSFTKVDHNNYLLASVDLEGLSFGIMMNNLFFDDNANADNMMNRIGAGAGNDPWDVASDMNGNGFKGFPKALGGDNPRHGYSLVDLVLKKLIFGLKFEMSPIEVAAQIMMEDYGVYFGGKWFVGPVTVGLSFMGILSPTDSDGARIDGQRNMKVGTNIEYNADSFGANIKGFIALGGNTNDVNATQIGVEPGFFYNVIPTHLFFRTDIGFYFTNVYNQSEKNTDKSGVDWAVRPQLIWNFLGTGAANGYYGMSTGMLFRYVLVSDAINALDIAFKFKF